MPWGDFLENVVVEKKNKIASSVDAITIFNLKLSMTYPLTD